MTFAIRQINLQFTKETGEVLNLKGLRCFATITNPGGESAFGQLQLRVYGMTLAQMNEFSSDGSNMVAVQNQSVTVIAGNEGSALEQVFNGTIISSYIDFSSPPEIAYVCSAIAGYYSKAAPSAANTYQGAQNAEDIIANLAQSIGYAFENNKAHAIIQNQYVSGSIIDQIQQIARSASFPLCIENKTVSIWPNDGTRDEVLVDISADTGMVGYPSYWEAGFVVQSEFKPSITIGRTINLKSQIPKANGKFPIHYVTHELSTLQPDGPWFTFSKLSPSVYVSKN